jgi:transposase-like protein
MSRGCRQAAEKWGTVTVPHEMNGIQNVMVMCVCCSSGNTVSRYKIAMSDLFARNLGNQKRIKYYCSPCRSDFKLSFLIELDYGFLHQHVLGTKVTNVW